MPFASDPTAMSDLVRSAYQPPRRLWRALLVALTVIAVCVGLAWYFLSKMHADRWGDVVRFSDSLEIYHGKGVTQDEAEALGRFLLKRGIGTNDQPATLRVERRAEDYALYVFCSSSSIASDAEAIAELRQLKSDVSKELFADEPVTVILCSHRIDRNAFGALGEPQVLKVIE
jgi:hypothetical protein